MVNDENLNEEDTYCEFLIAGLTRREIEICAYEAKKYIRSLTHGARNQTAINALTYEEALIDLAMIRIKKKNSK